MPRRQQFGDEERARNAHIAVPRPGRKRGRRLGLRHGLETRRRIVFAMRMGGASFASIGRALGFNAQRAHQIFRAKDVEVEWAAQRLQGLLHRVDPWEWWVRLEEAEQVA